ncbi:hypothetical protein JOD45_001949 [Scopulibacillus daqui]|uniref:Uncharacterized protein n=1 Tax=Scopulibacillus daqui TaxID=1469162 RepID=A0ABS2Q196_9BACL|nr:hypothetical protein [Scopulibacillus daqui]MBM7645730.1 hypothetical protein [Scopulibacillus daqui]
MSIKNFFNRLLHDNDDFRKIEKKLIEIECEIKYLKEALQQQQNKVQVHTPQFHTAQFQTAQCHADQCKNQSKSKQDEAPTVESPTIIEQVNVDKIIIDRYEQSNNFGALGIKSLEGKLNIGANYGLSRPIPKEKKEKYDQKMKKVGFLERNQPKQKKPGEPLKWNIKSK